MAYIENLTIEDANSEDEKRVLSKKIKDEINNIETLIGKNEENIKALDSRSLKLMEIENKFKDLIVNVSTKSFLYNALQAQLSAKSVKEGEGGAK